MNIRSISIIMALVCSICIWIGCETIDAVDPSKQIEVFTAPRDISSLPVSEESQDIDPGQYIACRIYDSFTMEYLENCEITIVSPQGGTKLYYLTVGKFQLKNITLGKYDIKVNKFRIPNII